jgi:hypothetical protein
LTKRQPAAGGGGLIATIRRRIQEMLKEGACPRSRNDWPFC